MPSRRRGFAALLALVLAALAAALALAWVARAGAPDRDAASDRALRQAREALLAYAADRAIDAQVGPGHLPCPDLDGDGWAEPTCGSLAGDSGQAQRLGWLPWKTLGLPDLRDGHGERPWYAVSTKHKGLLNCAASAACTDLSPQAALGTISVRDAAGTWLHDGRIGDPARAAEGGAVAVLLAPGAALVRDGRVQARACGAACPREFLERSAFGDNAAFVDRTDQRSGNGEGFVQGPAPGLNDRVLAVGYADLMPRIMARVAVEAAHCVRLAAARDGALPQPVPACTTSPPAAPFGRIPAVAVAGCTLDASGWWRHWREHAWLGVAGACGSGGGCLALLGRDQTPVSQGHPFAVAVGPTRGACTTPRLRCTAQACGAAFASEGLEVTRVPP